VTDLSDKGWLSALLAEELERYDSLAARARLPADVRSAGTSPTDLVPAARILVARSLRYRRIGAASTPLASFLDAVRQHVGLALDLALLRGEPFLRARQRAEIAAFLAAASGHDDLAVEVEPHEPGGASDRAVERALRAAAETLAERFFPPGDPVTGLPLYPGAVAVLRRRLARVVIGYQRDGRLAPDALARHGAYAARESALLAEALAALLVAAGAPVEPRTSALRVRQVARLGLGRSELRAARRSVAAPRGAPELAAGAPEPVRRFLVEQLLLCGMRVRLSPEPVARFVEAFAAAGGLDTQAVAAAQVEAAAQHDDHEAWVEAFVDGATVDWQALADEWEQVADHVVERVSTAVTQNVGAVVTEIRETGELGTLLARAAAGNTLSADEKRKVKAQLIDLAKAVPALAIFAAPGGMLLLPLLAKLLPFNLMPSAWDKPAPGPAPAKAGKPERPV
jgi:hypothetical protein